jgi:peptide/nickel transport system permease protein
MRADIAMPDDVVARRPSPRRVVPWLAAGMRLARAAPLACAAVFALLAMALFAPLIAPYDPYAGSVLERLLPPGSPGHWLGTDELGRDMTSRLVYGSRLSLSLALAPIGLALLIGGSIGALAGYAGGRLNTWLMRGIDVLFAFPATLLALAISGALGPGGGNLVIALTLVFIAPLARIAESETTRLRSADFVAAARLGGASALFIVRHHLLRCLLPPLLVYAASLSSVAMIYASGLSFLGLGTKPPHPEWGLMLNTLRNALLVQPLLCVLPGLMVCVTSLSLNRLSDALRDQLDARGR